MFVNEFVVVDFIQVVVPIQDGLGIRYYPGLVVSIKPQSSLSKFN